MNHEGATTEDVTGRYLGLVDLVNEMQPQITRLGAGIIAALLLDIAADTRQFARIFDVEHALVLREVNMLAQANGPLQITRRDARTQRSFFALSEAGRIFDGVFERENDI